MSNDLTKKTQIINRNRKQHISFKEDFVCIIDVDSWKEFNIDISESKKLMVENYNYILKGNKNNEI